MEGPRKSEISVFFALIQKDLTEIRTLSRKNADQLDELRSKTLPAIHQVISGDENWKKEIERRFETQGRVNQDTSIFKEKISEKVFTLMGGWTVILTVVFFVLQKFMN